MEASENRMVNVVFRMTLRNKNTGKFGMEPYEMDNQEATIEVDETGFTIDYHIEEGKAVIDKAYCDSDDISVQDDFEPDEESRKLFNAKVDLSDCDQEEDQEECFFDKADRDFENKTDR